VHQKQSKSTIFNSDKPQVCAIWKIHKCDTAQVNAYVYSVAELTLPQFYLFLHEMEKAKSVMEYLT